MKSTSDYGYQRNAMDQEHPGHASIMNYHYDGPQLQQRSNNQNAVQQSMPQGGQIHQTHPAYSYPIYVYPQTTHDYGASNQAQLHQENMAVNVQIHDSAMNLQSRNLSGVTGLQQPMWQQGKSNANEYGQNFGMQSQMQSPYSSPLSSSSGYSSYPHSHSSSSNSPSSNNLWQQQPHQNIGGAENNKRLYHDMSTSSYGQALSSEGQMHVDFGNAPQQLQAYQQPAHYPLAHNVSTESSKMPTSSPEVMNNNMVPARRKRKQGAPITIACSDEHFLKKDLSCDECNKLRDESKSIASTTYEQKIALMRVNLKEHAHLLSTIYQYFRHHLPLLMNEPGLSANDRQSIDAVLGEPEIVLGLSAEAMDRINAKKGVQKTRAKAQEEEADNTAKSIELATTVGEYVRILQHMQYAAVFRVMQH